MAEYDAQVELSIDLGDDKSNKAFQQLLRPLALEAVVIQTLRKAGITQPVTLTLLITNDETIQALNKQYRQQDKPTDVLSFPLLAKPIVNAPADHLWMPPEEASETASKQVFVTPSELTTNLGDVVISWPTVVRQAASRRRRYLMANSSAAGCRNRSQSLLRIALPPLTRCAAPHRLRRSN